MRPWEAYADYQLAMDGRNPKRSVSLSRQVGSSRKAGDLRITEKDVGPPLGDGQNPAYQR